MSGSWPQLRRSWLPNFDEQHKHSSTHACESQDRFDLHSSNMRVIQLSAMELLPWYDVMTCNNSLLGGMGGCKCCTIKYNPAAAAPTHLSVSMLPPLSRPYISKQRSHDLSFGICPTNRLQFNFHFSSGWKKWVFLPCQIGCGGPLSLVFVLSTGNT